MHNSIILTTCFVGVYRVLSSYKCIFNIFRHLFFVLVICFILLCHSAKSPKILRPRSDNDFMGKVDIPLEPTHETTLDLELNPRPKPSNLDKLFFFLSGEGTHILICQKARETNCAPQKKTSEVTNTPSLNAKKVKIMEGLLGCQSNISWYVLMIFAQTAFLRGRPNFIVENCYHGLHHGGLRKCNTRLCLIRFIGILGGSLFWKHIWHFKYLEVCVFDQIKTLRNSPRVQINNLTLQQPAYPQSCQLEICKEPI